MKAPELHKVPHAAKGVSVPHATDAIRVHGDLTRHPTLGKFTQSPRSMGGVKVPKLEI